MKQANILNSLKNPTRVSDFMTFDELFDDISNDLDMKIQRFRVRHKLED